jgi:hypothetical protein
MGVPRAGTAAANVTHNRNLLSPLNAQEGNKIAINVNLVPKTA